MDYNRTRAVVAGLASAVAFHFGTGFEPLWPLAWLVPLPVLAVAYRTSAPRAVTLALGAWVLGHLQLGAFLLGRLRVPLLVVVLLIGLSAVAFALVVLVSRALLRRGAPWAAAVAVPAM